MRVPRIHSRGPKRAGALAVVAVLAIGSARAEFLFEQFLTPGFDGMPDTEFSSWNVFYAPNGGQNFPDAAAPNGIYQTASAAGFINPGDWSPPNPLAYWHASNPTITQTNGGHFIIGPGTLGNIYSPSTAGYYRVADTTPYTLGTVVFQFQTDGQQVDFSSLRLRYDGGSGMVELAPDEWIREYRAGTAAFGGLANRIAAQWDLTGLGVANYEILFNATGSSMSFQRALLDTAATFEAVVPGGRTWAASGSGTWGDSAKWQEGSTPVPNGNVRFAQTGNATVALAADSTVAEIRFATPGDLTLNGPATLTANTGISTSETATGTYLVETPYALGAFNVMQTEAGTVRLDGPVSGAYGFLKTGAGTLVLGADNAFGTPTAGIGVQGGTLRIEGSNTYGGTSSVLWGRLVVAAEAPVSAPGALGNASSPVLVGASSAIFSSAPEAAVLVIDGTHTVARNIHVELGTFEKRIGAQNTGGDAIYSGNLSILGSGPNATSVKLFAANAADTVRFEGGISGGATTSHLRINADGETGTVVFSGADKTFANATAVHSGSLVIAAGTATTGNGAWTVKNGATLRVEGTLSGTGTFSLEPGATLEGAGTVGKSFAVGNGATLSPGNSTGTLATGAQTWAASGIYLWEINDAGGAAGGSTGWDLLTLSGTLTISADMLDPFQIAITSLNLGGSAGTLFNFEDHEDYAWTLATAAGGIAGFNPDAFQINTSGFLNTFTGTFAVEVAGNDLVLTYTAIPEPSTLLLILGASAAFALLAHRRWRSRRAP